MALVLEQLIRQAAQLGPHPSPADVEAVVLGALEDREYWQRLAEEMDGSARMLHWPDSGVRVAMTHRTNGRMSPIHSHQCWVALTPLLGIETHRRYDCGT